MRVLAVLVRGVSWRRDSAAAGGRGDGGGVDGAGEGKLTMETNNDGGPAFPLGHPGMQERNPGMLLRDYFAAHMQIDDRLAKCIRAMDDTALEIMGEGAEFFARWPDVEREEAATETGPLTGLTDWLALSEIQKVYRRLELETKALARVRYMTADAMLAARARPEAKP